MESNNELLTQQIDQKQDNSWLKCPITLEEFTEPVILSCGHTFNKPEIEKVLKEKAECPTCRKKDVAINSYNWVIINALDLKIETNVKKRKTKDELLCHYKKKIELMNEKLFDVIDSILEKVVEKMLYRVLIISPELVYEETKCKLHKDIYDALKKEYESRGFHCKWIMLGYENHKKPRFAISFASISDSDLTNMPNSEIGWILGSRNLDSFSCYRISNSDY